MRIVGILVILATLAAGPASAQQDPRLVPGARVRVVLRRDSSTDSSAAPRLVGRLRAMERDSLRLVADGSGTPQALGWSSVERLELSRGRVFDAGRMLRWASVGMLAGAAVGTAVTLSRGSTEFCGHDHASSALLCPIELVARLAPIGAGMGIGAVAGGVAGAVVRHEEWDHVGPRNLELLPTSRRGELRLAHPVVLVSLTW